MGAGRHSDVVNRDAWDDGRVEKSFRRPEALSHDPKILKDRRKLLPKEFRTESRVAFDAWLRLLVCARYEQVLSRLHINPELRAIRIAPHSRRPELPLALFFVRNACQF